MTDAQSGAIRKALIGNDVGTSVLPAFILLVKKKKTSLCWSEVHRRWNKQQRDSQAEAGC